MKKTKLIFLLCITVLFSTALAILVGCEIGGVEYKYDYLVTFDYNVDNLGVAVNCETQYLGVNAGNKIVAPGADKDKFKEYTINNYYNKGWFTAKLGADGKPLKDADGIVLDKQWDFSKDVVNGNMTLYADFHRNPTLTIKVEGGTDIVVSDTPGKEFSRPIALNVPERDGYTFIDYYADPEFTTKFTFPYVFAEDVDEECYAYMLEGEWAVVNNISDFRSSLRDNKNMYLSVPSGELVFGDLVFREGQFNVNYTGKIYGNGCVLKGIDITATYKNNQNTYSLFGNLGSTAVISDLTFENLTFTMEGLDNIATSDTEALQNIQASLFASNIADGATLSNLEFVNCVLDYGGVKDAIPTYGYYVTLPQGDEYDCFDLSNLTIKRNNQVVTLN